MEHLWNGFVDCLWHTLPLVLFGYGVWCLNAIKGNTGYWVVSLAVLAVVCIVASVAMMWFFGSAQHDYNELVEKRRKEIETRLDSYDNQERA